MVSRRRHELSLSAALDGETGLAALSPAASATWPKGGVSFFTQIGIEPSIAVTPRSDEPQLTFPARIGVD